MSDDPFAAVESPGGDAFREALAQQASAADPFQSAWVAANAGSGKTKVLIDRVARLLLRKAAPDSILCITYTRAAANEMLRRLFSRLGEWSVLDDPDLRGQLSRLEDRPVESFTEAELSRARALFARALETPGGLRIETIHALCGRLLRRFPLEAGIAPGFREIEEDEADQLWHKAVRDSLLEADEEARTALDALSLQGGGNGAMGTLAGLRGQVSPLMRFDRQCGGDFDIMRARLCAVIGASEDLPAEIITRAMGDEFPLADLRAALPVLLACGKQASARTAQAIEAALAETEPAARWQAYCGAFISPSSGKPYADLANASALKTPLIADLFATKSGEGREITRINTFMAAFAASEAVERNLARLRVGLPVLRRFASLKLARAALDFDDLIREARALLVAAGLSDWVLYKLDGGLSHVLLDEAQDTSPEQWQLLHALTAEFEAGHGAARATDPRTLFVVGDEKQSIYSFQGAAPEKFLTGRQRFIARNPDGRTPDMAMSFRSCPQVLEFVDTVFSTDAFDGHPFSVSPPPEADQMRHTARRENQPGRVELWPLVEAEAGEDADHWDAPLDAVRETTPRARLAAQIAGHVRELIDRGETIWGELADGRWQRRALTPGDFLILVRGRKSGLFAGLILALKRAGLPVAGADRLVLSEHLGVQDCLNLIRFALFERDDLSVAEILRGPFCGLVDDDEHLFALAHARGEASLYSRLAASSDPRHAAAYDFLTGVRDTRDLPAFEFLSRVLEVAGPEGETGWQKLLARLGTPARDPVEALLARALAHDSAGPSSLQTFLSAVERDAREIKRDLAEPGGAVRVMTVHGAKGLQAPVVILPDTVAGPKAIQASLLDIDDTPVWSPRQEGSIPRLEAARALESDKALREHRRLLYVALTRAQDRLIIAGAALGNRKQGFDATSWYGLCGAAMEKLDAAPDAAGLKAYGAPVPLRPGQDADAGAPADAPAWLRTAPPQEARTRRFLSPSHLAPDTSPVVALSDPARAARLARGRAIHALLEHLPQLAGDRRAQAARLYLSRNRDLPASLHDEIIKTSLATLSDPALAAVFAPHGRAEAAIVGAGMGWPQGTVINGRVDRLVVSDQEILIADIKTDRPPPVHEDDVSEAYFEQMAAYANVLEVIYPDRRMRCVIVWTHGPKLMELSQHKLLAALNRAQSRLSKAL